MYVSVAQWALLSRASYKLSPSSSRGALCHQPQTAQPALGSGCCSSIWKSHKLNRGSNGETGNNLIFRIVIPRGSRTRSLQPTVGYRRPGERHVCVWSLADHYRVSAVRSQRRPYLLEGTTEFPSQPDCSCSEANLTLNGVMAPTEEQSLHGVTHHKAHCSWQV